MNKRYMDFVPSAAKKKEVVKQPATRKVVARQTVATRKAVAKSQIVRELPTPKKNAAVAPRRSVASEPKRSEPELGVIEDLNPKSVNSDVPKRPLNSAGGASARDAKAQKVGTKTEARATVTVGSERQTTFAVPKSPFINQEKVIKRPLSKNAYVAKAPEVKLEKSGPVTIISKPKKEAHVSLIVTIIITIILGAAAGTVAFLLLPK